MLAFALFLLITAFCILCSGALTRTLWLFTREGGAFDILFNWQDMLDKLYKGSPGKQLLGKALGDCGVCFAFWLGPICYVLHYIIAGGVMASWPISGVAANVVYFIFFWNLVGFTNFLFIRKIM